jgi:hypothetical protein
MIRKIIISTKIVTISPTTLPNPMKPPCTHGDTLALDPAPAVWPAP